MVALYYATGNSVPVNYEEAVKWFRLAAETGFAESQHSLGLCYANGSGVSKDTKEAVRFYRLAAEQGHAPAAYSLGHCYSNGNGVPKDDVEAMKWLHLAAVYGDERALPELKNLRRGKSPEQIAEANKRVREYLERLSPKQLTIIAAQSAINKSDKSSSESPQQHTGIKASDDLFFGAQKSVVEGKQQSIEEIKAQAEKGNAAAQFELGLRYYHGLGLQSDYREAVNWYRKAAAKGHALAQLNLGVRSEEHTSELQSRQ